MYVVPERDEVIGYLEAQGWRPRAYWHKGRIWSHGLHDVMVPSGPVADYTACMQALVECVAHQEQRTPEVVVRDIVSGGVDVIGYRVGDGEVSLDVGAAVLTALRGLLVSCADQVAASEIRSAALRRSALDDLLDSTTWAPRRDPFGFDLYLAGPGSRLGRNTAVRLLDVAATVLGATRDDRAMASGSAREIGYDTAAAFVALGSADHRPMRFELSFRWSRQVPRPDVAVEFTRDEVARLPVLRELAAAPPDDRFEQTPGAAVVEGVVTGLDIEGSPKAIVRGVLRVGDASTGRRRRITVHLGSADEYATALAALSSGVRVRATGAFDGKRDLHVSENGFAVVDGEES